ncbi:MAG: 50S ribosomal protein L2 [Xanthomonadaceae bacterium]|nr:50S ribosomal protein L2 [Xanthomonadaceae bacterium]
MPVKSFRPITPARRYLTVADFSALTKKKDQPKKPRALTTSLSKNGGRNSYGRITMRHQSGGHKRMYRKIDFLRNKLEIPGTVASIEYDPNRTAFIALINYADGEKRYILCPQNLIVGSKIIASDKADIQPGNHLSLQSIPVGTLIHNIEVEPGKGGKMSRSAGQYGQLVAKEGENCQVKLPSGEIRFLNRNCKATIGSISNAEHENIKIGKAGRSRWKGIRPTVRGVAMNPIDHPMGGGEGKASGGQGQSPWGTPSKGYKTRNNKRTDRFIVKRRK